MKVVAFAGYSGAGKTTLIERLIPLLTARALRVSTLKHAHHAFDIDQPGKDTWRHREAGAFEVVAASDRRLALMREFEAPTELSVHRLIAELDHRVDWVMVEGFKRSDLPKIEIHRGTAADRLAGAQQDVYDRFVLAIASDAPQDIRPRAGVPVLDLNNLEAMARWLIDNGDRFEYKPELYE